ncbi:MAG TPA: hypothetical protein P5216_05880, partial [Bacteroidota bacterium]|nr:hypothetical protein [Bacteroidota bacterium]
MKKLVYILFVLFFLACNLSQAQSIFSRDSSKINSAAFYIVYNNWNDTLGSTNLIGVGGRIEIQDRPIFQEFEILLPIGRKTMEVGMDPFRAGKTR